MTRDVSRGLADQVPEASLRRVASSPSRTGGGPGSRGGARPAGSLALEPARVPIETPPHELALRNRLASGRGSLPVLPRVAAVAMKLAANPDVPFDELETLLRSDPSLAARLVSFANSACFRRGAPVGTIRAAIGRLGLIRTRDLVFQTVYAASATGMGPYRSEAHASIRRSVRCATIAEVVATHLEIEVEAAYLVGLLHDIGEVRIFRLLEGIEVPSPDEPAKLVAAFHASAGRDLAVAWQLPEAVVEACGAHHDDTATGVGPRLARATDAVVEALPARDATLLAQRLGFAVDRAEELRRAAADAVRAAGG